MWRRRNPFDGAVRRLMTRSITATGREGTWKVTEERKTKEGGVGGSLRTNNEQIASHHQTAWEEGLHLTYFRPPGTTRYLSSPPAYGRVCQHTRAGNRHIFIIDRPTNPPELRRSRASVDLGPPPSYPPPPSPPLLPPQTPPPPSTPLPPPPSLTPFRRRRTRGKGAKRQAATPLVHALSVHVRWLGLRRLTYPSKPIQTYL